MTRTLIATLLLVALTVPVAAQTVLRVDADRPAGGDGLAWETAFDDLQDALAAATDLGTPVDVWIAEGTYLADRPESTPFRSFEPPAHCRLLGGFAGHEEDGAALPRGRLGTRRLGRRTGVLQEPTTLSRSEQRTQDRREQDPQDDRYDAEHREHEQPHHAGVVGPARTRGLGHGRHAVSTDRFLAI